MNEQKTKEVKISELIKMLEEAKEKYGDIPVFCWPYDGQMGDYYPAIEEGEDCIVIDGRC